LKSRGSVAPRLSVIMRHSLWEVLCEAEPGAWGGVRRLQGSLIIQVYATLALLARLGDVGSPETPGSG